MEFSARIGIAKAVNTLRNKGKSDAANAEPLDMDVKEVQLIQQFVNAIYLRYSRMFLE